MGTLSPLRYASAGAAAALQTALLVNGTGLPPVPATGDAVIMLLGALLTAGSAPEAGTMGTTGVIPTSVDP